MADQSDYDDKTVLINKGSGTGSGVHGDMDTVLKQNASSTAEMTEQIELKTAHSMPGAGGPTETISGTAYDTGLHKPEQPDTDVMQETDLQPDSGTQVSIQERLGITGVSGGDRSSASVSGTSSTSMSSAGFSASGTSFDSEIQETDNSGIYGSDDMDEEPTRILQPGFAAHKPVEHVEEEVSSIEKTDMREASIKTPEQADSSPVVGWLVVVDGPGKGSSRQICYGNNTIGRSSSQRIPLNFGDTAISSEEQAYIQYHHKSREFLFVPNLSKPNIVEVNEANPVSAVSLNAYDVIRMGETSLLFVPLCGPNFEWNEVGAQ